MLSNSQKLPERQNITPWQGCPSEQLLYRIQAVCQFESADPKAVLGLHRSSDNSGQIINAFIPKAKSCTVILADGQELAPSEILPGFFQLELPTKLNVQANDYKIRYQLEGDERIFTRHDPYSFGSIIGDLDKHLFGEGNHLKIYEKLGAQLCEIDGIQGVHFATWAPNAKAVSVTADFNHWDQAAHPMQRLGESGLWALFIPNLQAGEVYKYAIRAHDGERVLIKTDPYGFQSELRPKTASIVADLSLHTWRDDAWLQKRKENKQIDTPMSVYEVHLGSWRRPEGVPQEIEHPQFLSYTELAPPLIAYVKEMGFTHIELMPVMEHPLDMSWGYQVTGYYAPSSRFGKPDEFMAFVDLCHQNDIGVILDWVPAHFPRDGHSLGWFDGKHIYAYEDTLKGEHKEWGTLVFDFGRNEVVNFLAGNAFYWFDKYHIDGLRVDAVSAMLYQSYGREDAEWTPNAFGGCENLEALAFIKKLNTQIKENFPDVLMIAEEATAWPQISGDIEHGGLGFDLKWNMGWMHDSLFYINQDPIYRKFHHDSITFPISYAFSEKYVLPISHDEVVYGKKSLLQKMPGDTWQKFANLRLFLALMFGYPGKKLLFMGSEFGQSNEWYYARELDWWLLEHVPHQQIQSLVKFLNSFYRRDARLFDGDFSWDHFEWIDCSDRDNSVLTFTRWNAAKTDYLLFVANMTPLPRYNYRIGLPHPGAYREILSTDSGEYGGSGFHFPVNQPSEPVPWQSREHSLVCDLPPLGVYILEKIKDHG